MKVSNVPGKKLEHQGIRVQLLGQIELLSSRGHFHDFVALGEPSDLPSELFRMPLAPIFEG